LSDSSSTSESWLLPWFNGRGYFATLSRATSSGTRSFRFRCWIRTTSHSRTCQCLKFQNMLVMVFSWNLQNQVHDLKCLGTYRPCRLGLHTKRLPLLQLNLLLLRLQQLQHQQHLLLLQYQYWLIVIEHLGWKPWVENTVQMCRQNMWISSVCCTQAFEEQTLFSTYQSLWSWFLQCWQFCPASRAIYDLVIA